VTRSPGRRRGILTWLGRLLGAIAGGYLGYVAFRGSRLLVSPEVRPLQPDVEGGPATPADVGLAYEEVRFTADDGVTLVGWLIAAGRETRSAVILMHGFTGHRLADLAFFVPWLQPRYHVLQFDFRGHGASDPSRVTLGTMERRDVAAAVRYLESCGLGPIALMGISMGAAIAIVAAPDLPVAAVIADTPFADLHHPIANRLRQQGYPLARLGSRAIVGAAAVRARTRLLSPIQRVKRLAPRPLLLITTQGDTLINWRQSLRLYRAAEEPKELFVVDGGEHAQAYALAGPVYERRVLDFLARHLDGGSAEAKGADAEAHSTHAAEPATPA
jgi:pimeloyl-ACP methyl ester carboxylesterase